MWEKVSKDEDHFEGINLFDYTSHSKSNNLIHNDCHGGINGKHQLLSYKYGHLDHKEKYTGNLEINIPEEHPIISTFQTHFEGRDSQTRLKREELQKCVLENARGIQEPNLIGDPPNQNLTKEKHQDNLEDEQGLNKNNVYPFIKLFEVLFNYPVQETSNEEKSEDKNEKNTNTIKAVNNDDIEDDGNNKDDIDIVDDETVESGEIHEDPANDQVVKEDLAEKTQSKSMKIKNIPISKPFIRPTVTPYKKTPPPREIRPPQRFTSTTKQKFPPPPSNIPPPTFESNEEPPKGPENPTNVPRKPDQRNKDEHLKEKEEPEKDEFSLETLTDADLNQLVFQQPERAEADLNIPDKSTVKDAAPKEHERWIGKIPEPFDPGDGDENVGRDRELEGLPEATMFELQPYGWETEKAEDGTLIFKKPPVEYEKLEMTRAGVVLVNPMTEKEVEEYKEKHRLFQIKDQERKRILEEKRARGEIVDKPKDKKKWTRGNEIDLSTDDDLPLEVEQHYGTTWKEFVNTPQVQGLSKTNPRGIIPGAQVKLTSEFVRKFVEDRGSSSFEDLDSYDEEYDSDRPIPKKYLVGHGSETESSDEDDDEDDNSDKEEDLEEEEESSEHQDESTDSENVVEEKYEGPYIRPKIEKKIEWRHDEDDYSDGEHVVDHLQKMDYNDGLDDEAVEQLIENITQRLHSSFDQAELNTFGQLVKEDKTQDKRQFLDNNYNDEEESDYDDGRKHYIAKYDYEASSESSAGDTEVWETEETDATDDDEEIASYDDGINENISYSDGIEHRDSDEDCYVDEEDRPFKGVVSVNPHFDPYYGEGAWEKHDHELEIEPNPVDYMADAKPEAKLALIEEGLAPSKNKEETADKEWNASAGEYETTDQEELEYKAKFGDTTLVGISLPPKDPHEDKEDSADEYLRGLNKRRKWDGFKTTTDEDEEESTIECSSDPEGEISGMEEERDNPMLQRDTETFTQRDIEEYQRQLEDVPEGEQINFTFEMPDSDPEAEKLAYRYPSEDQHIFNIRVKNISDNAAVYGEDNPFVRKPPPPYEETIGVDSYYTLNPVYPEGYYEGIKEATPESIKEAKEYERFLDEQSSSSSDEDDSEEEGGRYKWEHRTGGLNTGRGDGKRWQSWKAKSVEGSVDVLKSTAKIWKPQENPRSFEQNSSEDWKNKGDQWQHYRTWLMKKGTKVQPESLGWPNSPLSPMPDGKPTQGKSERLLERLGHWQSYQTQKRQTEQENTTRRDSGDSSFVFKKPPSSGPTTSTNVDPTQQDTKYGSEARNTPEQPTNRPFKSNNPNTNNTFDANNKVSNNYNPEEGPNKVHSTSDSIKNYYSVEKKESYFQRSSSTSLNKSSELQSKQSLSKRGESFNTFNRFKPDSVNITSINLAKYSYNQQNYSSPALKLSKLKTPRDLNILLPLYNDCSSSTQAGNGYFNFNEKINLAISNILANGEAEPPDPSEKAFSEAVQPNDEKPEKPKRKYTRKSKITAGGGSDDNDNAENLKTNLEPNNNTPPKRKYTRRKKTNTLNDDGNKDVVDSLRNEDQIEISKVEESSKPGITSNEQLVSENPRDAQISNFDKDFTPTSIEFTNSPINEKAENYKVEESSKPGITLNEQLVSENPRDAQITNFDKDSTTTSIDFTISPINEKAENYKVEESSKPEITSNETLVSQKPTDDQTSNFDKDSTPTGTDLSTSSIAEGLNKYPYEHKNESLSHVEEEADIPEHNSNAIEIVEKHDKDTNIEISSNGLVSEEKNTDGQNRKLQDVYKQSSKKKPSKNIVKPSEPYNLWPSSKKTGKRPPEGNGFFRHYQSWIAKEAGGAKNSWSQTPGSDSPKPEEKGYDISAKNIFTSTFRPTFKDNKTNSHGPIKVAGDHWQHYKDWLIKKGIDKLLYRTVFGHPVRSLPEQVIRRATILAETKSQPIISKTTEEKVQLLHQRWLNWQQKLASRMVDKLNKRLRMHEAPALFSGGKLDPMTIRDLIRQRDYWREIHRWSVTKNLEMYNKTPANVKKSPSAEMFSVPSVVADRPTIASWPGKKSMVQQASEATPRPEILVKKWTPPDMQDLNATEGRLVTRDPIWPTTFTVATRASPIRPQEDQRPSRRAPYRASIDREIYPQPPKIEPVTISTVKLTEEEKKEVDDLSVALGGQEVYVTEANKIRKTKAEKEEIRKVKYKKNKLRKRRIRARTGT